MVAECKRELEVSGNGHSGEKGHLLQWTICGPTGLNGLWRLMVLDKWRVWGLEARGEVVGDKG